MDVAHGHAARAVHAVPPVPVEEDEVHGRGPRDLLVDAIELLD